MKAQHRVEIESTSKHPRDEVEMLIRFAHGGRETGAVAVNVKNTPRAYAGRAYMRVPRLSNRYGDGCRYLVTLRIGAASKFPRLGCQYPGLKTAPVYDLLTWQEALVLLAAHEFTHCLQYAQGLRRSEIDAETRAVQCLARYRAWRDSQASA